MPGLSYKAFGGYWVGLTSGRTGGLVHYILYELDILNIFSECSLKIPRIYSNIFLSGGREGLLDVTGMWAVRAGGQVSE
jgi:hypothetical protein